MNILLTGGAGYIGSHTAIKFIENNCNVTIIDSLITGSKKLIPKEANFISSDIADKEKLSNILKKNNFDLVLHFAAFTKVGESVQNPEKYYENNYEKSKVFFDLCIKNKITNIIFSSTGSVYGNVNGENILESSKTSPINPYSKSKLKVEEHLKELTSKKLINSISLRYFNVAGADYKLRSGLMSNPDNLIKAICEVMNGKRPELVVNGNNYDTKDGTTIRDYIHVSDLAEMHYLASIDIIKNKTKKLEIFNCGYGHGFSIMDVIRAMQEVTNKKINFKYGPPRIGDADFSVANIDKFKKKFNWNPKFDDLKIILKSALDWEKNCN
jgi:UDP-glucose 4-epimerase